MLEFNRSEQRLLKRLSTPVRVQDYLETLRANFEETCLSPRRVMREGKANCMEGAMLAAAAFWYHGVLPLLLDLKAVARDQDHVVALFRYRGRWGAVSKTNHAVLRYREPVYRDVRELAMSYFHEYFLHDGRKTLRSYSRPFDLSRFSRRGWMTAEEDVWYVPEALDVVSHQSILTSVMVRRLRRADPIEIAAGKIVQWRRRR